MVERTLRELLNRLRWHPAQGAAGVRIAVRRREAGAERVVPVDFEEVAEILPAGCVLADGTFVPYHRIAAVERGSERLWPPAREGA